MTVDIDGLSASELKDLIKRAGKKLDTQAEEEKAALRKEVENLVKARGFTMAELFGFGKALKPKTELPITHRDPQNPKNTWKGRGKKPTWLTKALAAGASIEDFKVSS